MFYPRKHSISVHITVIVITVVLMLSVALIAFLILRSSPLAQSLSSAYYSYPWAILIGGAFCSLLVGVSLLLGLYRALQAEKLADALSKRNRELNEEVEARSRAQQELSRQRHEYRTIFDSVPSIILYTSMDGRVKRINMAGAAAIASTPREVVGRHLTEIFGPAFGGELLHMSASVVDAGKPILGQIGHHALPTGAVVWSYTCIIPCYDSEGKFTGAVSVIQDMTDREAAQEALAESEQRYRSLFENNPVPVYSLDLDGKFLSANTAALRTSGYSFEELATRNFRSIMVQEDLEMAVEHFTDACHGETRNFQARIINALGMCVYLDITNSPMTVNSEIVGVYGVARDITEQKRILDALAESQEMFKMLAEESPNIIAIVLKSGNIAYINKRGLELLGFSREEYSLAFHFRTVIDPEDLAVATTDFNRNLSGEVGPSAEYRLITKAGRRLDALVNFRPIKYHNDTAILAVITDITERKKHEETLAESYCALKKSLNDAINTMAHIVEIRDPYTAGHQQRVTSLAVAIARELRFEEDRIDRLRMAAVIHDIGKLYIPSEILSKPGKLGKIEFMMITAHSESGYGIVKGMDFPWPVAETILQHHERLDGSGYPRGLKGCAILLEAKIIGVADTVEAMASHRPYRAALGIDHALAQISSKRGILYDEDVVDACLRLFSEGRFAFEHAV